ncbi:hypothetical protein FHS01_000026 [Longimicrobium terrae]|uniref:Uncharacterized protein n=1 Tax=Longimicrobium terrae TaxID=1639882 RepID=A0A841GQ06_9BACT|nr:hypothetical protein [Longimicrobium terrae]MBB6069090.1 hypothetical protein [Longimicrobium terrae]
MDGWDDTILIPTGLTGKSTETFVCPRLRVMCAAGREAYSHGRPVEPVMRGTDGMKAGHERSPATDRRGALLLQQNVIR